MPTTLVPEKSKPRIGLPRRRQGQGGGETTATPRPSAALGMLTGPVALLTFGIAAIAAGNRPLQGDDFATWYAASLPMHRFWELIDHIDAVHGVYYLFLHYWIGLFGDSALSLRLPSIIAASLTAAAISLLGRRLYGATAGVLGGLVYALTPAVSHYGTEVRSYAAVSLVVVVATILLYRALDHPTWMRWAGYACALFVHGMLHFVSLLVLAAHVIAVVMAIRNGNVRARRWFPVTGIAIVAIVPLLVKAQAESFAVAGHTIGARDVIFFSTSLTQSITIKVFVLGLAIFAAIFGFRQQASVSGALVAWMVAPPIICFVVYPIAPLFAPRYLAFTYPAWALLAGAGAAQMRALVARSGRRWATPAVAYVAAIFLLAVLGLSGQVRVHTNRIIGVPDLTGAARYVQAHRTPADAIAYGAHWLSAGPGLARQFNRYTWRHQPQPRDVLINRTSEQAHLIDPIECKTGPDCALRLRGVDRVWLESASIADSTFDGMGQGPAEALGADFIPQEVHDFRGVRLILLVRRGPATHRTRQTTERG